MMEKHKEVLLTLDPRLVLCWPPTALVPILRQLLPEQRLLQRGSPL